MTRDEKMKQMFEGGAIQRDLALAFDLSRERIRQILMRDLGSVVFHKTLKRNIKNYREELAKTRTNVFICLNCGIDFKVKYIKRRYCSKKCFRAYLKKNSPTEEEKKEKRSQQMKEYYKKRLKIN